jgi:hypothetical protein
MSKRAPTKPRQAATLRDPLPALTNRPPIRRLTRTITSALALGLLVAALLGPSQTFAQTRKAACTSSAVHTKAKRAARACTQSSHKGKHKPRHAAKGHTKHASSKTSSKRGSGSAALIPASCEDGSVPVRAGDGSFSCADGSEPECENGASPTASHNGRSLLCPVPAELTSGSSEGEGENECEEEGLSCTPVTGSGSGEQICDMSASDGSSFVCEGEG